MNDNIAKAISLFISGVTQSLGEEIVVTEDEVKTCMESAQHKVGLLMNLVDIVSSSDAFRELVDSIKVEEVENKQEDNIEPIKAETLELD